MAGLFPESVAVGAEFGFEFKDLLGERWLGDVGMFGGTREAAFLGDHQEDLEFG